MENRHEFYVHDKKFALNAVNFERISHAFYFRNDQLPVSDRDAKIFENYIWPHLVGYKLYLNSLDLETLWRIMSDAQFYRLPELEEQVSKAIGPIASLNDTNRAAKIEEQVEKIKLTYRSVASLVGSLLGARLGRQDLVESLLSEMDDFDDEIHECAEYTVTHGGEFLNLNPTQKLIMSIGMKLYFKVFAAHAMPENNNNYEMYHPPDDFIDVAQPQMPVFHQVQMNLQEFNGE